MSDSYTYFIFDPSVFRGYRCIIEKNFTKVIRKIKYDSFQILSTVGNVTKFKIQNQLIRKLKLKYINGDIKIGGVESKIIELINKSQKINLEDENIIMYSWYYNETRFGPYDGQIKELRERSKYQERFYKQKLKNYNKR